MSEKFMFDMSFEQIKELMEFTAEKGLGKVTLKDQNGSEITIEGKKEKCPPPMMPPMMGGMQPFQPQAAANVTVENNVATEDSSEKISGNVVTSPLVGTFYASAAPDKPAFVKVGDTVKEGDVLMIIESMKVMNEIQSKFSGTVKKILVTDGTGVEYDQPLMIIE